MTLRRAFLIIVFFQLALAGCIRPSQEPVKTTPVHAATLFRTWTPEVTPATKTSTSTRASPTPTITKTPTPQPTEIDLGEEGPWILLCTQAGDSFFHDLHGSGSRRYASSCEPAISPAGDTGVTTTFDRVLFTDLPSMETLLEYEFPDGVAASGVMGIFATWSPDGAIYAFLEAIGPTVSEEVLLAHLYVRQDNAVTTLETAFEIDDLMGWSPDSRYLILRGSVPGLGDGIWAADIVDGSLDLIDRSLSTAGEYAIGEIAGWTSNTTFIDWQNFRRREDEFGACDRAVREVDLRRGLARTLAGPTSVMPPALDPTTRTVLFSVASVECEDSLAPGLYRYGLGRGRAERIESWTELVDLAPEWPIRWWDELGLFEVEASYPDQRLALYTPAGELFLTIDDAYRLSPSPDGRWIMVFTWQEDYLIDQAGNAVEGFLTGEYNSAVWLPDSSGLYLNADRGAALLRAENGWSPQWVPGVDSVGLYVLKTFETKQAFH
ncbi:MAG: hypothetical protein GTO14_06030 [Anaerolineales bacterium]|nr:hypothetical protein [Anaerolineales bacterium]